MSVPPNTCIPNFDQTIQLSAQLLITTDNFSMTVPSPTRYGHRFSQNTRPDPPTPNVYGAMTSKLYQRNSYY